MVTPHNSFARLSEFGQVPRFGHSRVQIQVTKVQDLNCRPPIHQLLLGVPYTSFGQPTYIPMELGGFP